MYAKGRTYFEKKRTQQEKWRSKSRAKKVALMNLFVAHLHLRFVYGVEKKKPATFHNSMWKTFQQLVKWGKKISTSINVTCVHQNSVAAHCSKCHWEKIMWWRRRRQQKTGTEKKNCFTHEIMTLFVAVYLHKYFHTIQPINHIVYDACKWICICAWHGKF